MKVKITIALWIALIGQLTAQTLPSYVPSNGLVGWWPFNGNANDESGNGNHGTVNGATLTEDRLGNVNSSFNFNGYSSFIEIPSSPEIELSTQYTISVWLNATVWSFNAPIDQHAIVSKIDNGDWYGGYEIRSISAGNLMHSGNISSNFDIGLGGYANLQWHHVLVSYDGIKVRSFINGVLVDSIARSGTLQTSNIPLRFGRRGGAGYYNNWFNGKIDDVAIYNRALTPSEITALYNGTTDVSGCTNATACNYNASATLDDGTCTFPAQTYLNCDGTCINDTDADGICNELETPALPAYFPTNALIGYWPFNGNANDESGNGNHGTVNGATLTADRNGNANCAYSFDGVNDFIHINNFNANCQDLTIFSWIKVENYYYNPTYQQTMIYLGTEAGNSNSLTHTIDLTIDPINYSPPRIRYNLNYDYGSCGNQDMNTNWISVCGVFKGSSQQIEYYVNSQLLGTCAVSANGILISSDDVNNFGAGWNFSNLLEQNFFKGLLDDIAIYNRALTASEITALYIGTSSNNGGGNGGTAGTPAASVPAGIPYQAVIRDNAGTALVNAPVSVRFTLHQNTTNGTVEYQETQSLNTNAIGLINTQFGAGTATQGTFANINWSNTTKFIQVEVNTGNGFVDIGTQQLMSVPFAFQANKATAIKNAGLPVYADNAAALAGGLVAGEMYRTAAGILMVVY
jgi:hypothetical protein